MFVITDELSIKFIDSKNSTMQVPLLNTEIAWPSDKEIKFQNPQGGNLAQGEFHLQSCSQVCLSQNSLYSQMNYFGKCHTSQCSSLAYLLLHLPSNTQEATPAHLSYSLITWILYN